MFRVSRRVGWSPLALDARGWRRPTRLGEVTRSGREEHLYPFTPRYFGVGPPYRE